MGYDALRESFHIELSKYGFGNAEAEGVANIDFISSSAASGDLPEIGDILYDYGYYGGGGVSSSYPNIKVTRIEQRPYHIENSTDGFKYTVSFASAQNVGRYANNFSGDITVSSWNKPFRWRLADNITDVNSVSNIFGTHPHKLSKVVPSGQFIITKEVSDAKLSSFWAAYLKIVGRLNQESIFALYGISSGIEFARGQVLCSGLEMQDRSPSGSFIFNTVFRWKIINDYKINGSAITSDDFNYFLIDSSDSISGSSASTWVAPVQTGGTASDTLVSNPFVYNYAGSNDYTDFLAGDWAT